MRQILAIAHKEVLHIVRDLRSLIVAIVMPIFMVLLYGYAIDMEMRDLPVAILDQDNSPESRELISRTISSDFIVDVGRLEERDQIETGFRRKKWKAALIIPTGYGETLSRNENAEVQLLIDGADASTAQSVNTYLNAIINTLNQEMMFETTGKRMAAPIQPTIRYYFNPEMNSATFVVPGLTAVIMIMICALLTSIAVTREKETGTLEQILTSPIHPYQVMIGKVLPYMVISFVDAALVLVIGFVVFHVPMMGNWIALILYSIIYLFISLAFGLLVSAIANTQQVAMLLALLATMLPSLIISGFIFPLTSMPKILQWFAYITPATYYLRIIRGILLAGRSWFPLEGGFMVVMAIGLMVLAVGRFKSRLE